MTTIPQTADAFKDWVDRECDKWPAELQAMAYGAWRTMQGSTLWMATLDSFTVCYRQWEAAQS